jgi:hypothetical protein
VKPYRRPKLGPKERRKIVKRRDYALIKQGYRCIYCHDRLTHEQATADHRMPVVSGGNNRQSNIVAACIYCNLAKGCLSFEAFVSLVYSSSVPTERFPFVAVVWARRHLNDRAEKAERRIRRAVGMAPL